jgi:hypothetical protein
MIMNFKSKSNSYSQLYLYCYAIFIPHMRRPRSLTLIIYTVYIANLENTVLGNSCWRHNLRGKKIISFYCWLKLFNFMQILNYMASNSMKKIISKAKYIYLCCTVFHNIIYELPIIQIYLPWIKLLCFVLYSSVVLWHRAL